MGPTSYIALLTGINRNTVNYQICLFLRKEKLECCIPVRFSARTHQWCVDKSCRQHIVLLMHLILLNMRHDYLVNLFRSAVFRVFQISEVLCCRAAWLYGVPQGSIPEPQLNNIYMLATQTYISVSTWTWYLTLCKCVCN